MPDTAKVSDFDSDQARRDLRAGKSIVLATIALCFGVALVRVGIHAYFGSIDPFPVLALCVVMATAYALFHGDLRAKRAFTFLMAIAAGRLYVAAFLSFDWSLAVFATIYASALVILNSSSSVSVFLDSQRLERDRADKEAATIGSETPQDSRFAYCDYCDETVEIDDYRVCLNCNWPV